MQNSAIAARAGAYSTAASKSVARALLTAGILIAAWNTWAEATPPPSSSREASSTSSYRALIDRYCVVCHGEELETAGLRLDLADMSNIGESAEVWEKVVHKLRADIMPPADRPQPSVGARRALLSWLETSLDDAAAANPKPGRTESLRRLNRTEYQNSIRDLLSLDIDATALLPHDESGHGFDNVNVGDLSPTLLDRYVSAAQKVSRLAIGSTQGSVESTHGSVESSVIRVKPDISQEAHIPGLPIGTRGGVLIPHTFPQDGEYDIQIWLTRNRNEKVEGLKGPEDLVLLLDRKRIETFTVKPPSDREDHTQVDKHLTIRISVTAGPHDLGVTFPKVKSSLLETGRQPLESRFNYHRHPRTGPAVFQVSIRGPYAAQGAGDTPSRRRIFVANPTRPDEEEDCAKQILTTLLRRAYRRPVSEADITGPMAFYREGRSEGSFDIGIERALTAVLVSPEFLFRIETEPEGMASGAAYRISDIELASRLSFFLWSSIPDDELLDAAIRGELSTSGGLEKQARRLLADPRSYNLASNFAGQWLHLRKLDTWGPDARLFPDIDDNLRQSFRKETELLVDSVLRKDGSVLDLLKADYTFLNERLAKHYGIPHIYGTRFRRVSLEKNSERGGLLRHGSILAITSYATRTSPVVRGKWVLDNILGVPPPPPPPNVSTLENNVVNASLPIRERMSEHRSNPVCASCHRTIDPIGFALENFDPVGRWRDYENGAPVDASGGLPGVGEFEGVAGLEEGLLSRPELFVGTFTRKLLTFALGRGIDYYDAPAVRKILREAEPDGYRFSSIILGIVNSTPFQMRNSIMIITKKALSRRTFLRGAQATLALPLLDAMIPAATALEKTAGKPVPRLGFVFIPMGTDHSRWTPQDTGKLGELTPILRPLEPVKDQVTVITNLDLQNSYPGTHTTSNAGFLSAAFAKHTEGSDYYLGTTVDQIAAKSIGQETQLPSLELSMDLFQTVGQCNNGYACAYANNLSWSSPTTPLPSEAHPRLVFERLFGEGGSRAERRAALRTRASLLDWVMEDLAKLKKDLGMADRVRVDNYLDSVREVERQIQRAEAGVEDNPLPDLDRPTGVPAAYADHAKLMFDLQVLVLQGDITRVITFQLARELSTRTYPEVGVPDPHHPISHHGNDPEKVAKLAKINEFHVSLFAGFLEKLKATPDGNGSLLDNSIYLYGSGMGNPSTHDHDNLPILVAGGAACGMNGGRHIKYENGTPLANLHLTLLDRVGVFQDSFADSNGKIEELFDAVPV